VPEPTVAELFRLEELWDKQWDMPELRWRRLWAAYAAKFGTPFSDGEKWLWGEEAVMAWRQWAGLEKEYSL